MKPKATWMTLLALVAGLALLGSGCAAQKNQQLMQVRTQFDQASADPTIQNNASLSLYEAEQALQRAESAQTRGADENVVDHLTYLAAQRLAIAEANAERKEAQNRVAELEERRSETLLSARDQKLEQQGQTIAELRDELEAKETDRGTLITLSDVLFEVDKATLKPGAQRILSKVVDYLEGSPERRLLVEGHTDSTGAGAYNEELSRERARSVANFLTRNGVDPQRITARGYGEDYPVATNDTMAGRQQNRRVEIVVLNEGEKANDHVRGASR